MTYFLLWRDVSYSYVMNKHVPENYSLWGSSSFEAFREAQRREVPFHVTCSLWRSGKAVDMSLRGKLLSVSGSEALFEVQERKVLPGRSKGEESECEFSFSLEQNAPTGVSELLGFLGRGRVLGMEKNIQGEPQLLSLRLARWCAVRRLRRDRRVTPKEWKFRLAGVTVVSPPPANRKELSDILGAYYQAQPQPLFSMVNISAGGTCLCLSDELAAQTFTGNAFYLFLLVPDTAAPGEKPHIFLSRKLGQCREVCERGSAVRLRFLQELDWEASSTTLKWIDIECTGSTRLRMCIEEQQTDQIPAAASA